MRTIGRLVLWALAALLGSGVIFFVAIFSIEHQSLPKLRSGSVFTSFWHRGFVSATGTWIIEGTKQAFPRQTTEIKCYRDEKECVSAQAEVTFDDTLYLHTERMTVTSWDANTIVYTSTEPTCVTYVYTITRASERVTGQRRPKQSTEDSCKMLEQRVLNLTLRDGLNVWLELQNEVAAKTYPFMWAALGVWWAFVVFQMVRRPQTRIRLQDAQSEQLMRTL